VRGAQDPDQVRAQLLSLVPGPEAIEVTITPHGTTFSMVCARCRLDQPLDAFYTGPNRLSRTLVCEGCREAEESTRSAANAARSRAAARLIEQYQDRYHELVEQELEVGDEQNGRRGVPLHLRAHPRLEEE
jgi:MinD superfamily P-loop ATPase